MREKLRHSKSSYGPQMAGLAINLVTISHFQASKKGYRVVSSKYIFVIFHALEIWRNMFKISEASKDTQIPKLLLR